MKNSWKTLLAGLMIIIAGSVTVFASEEGNENEAAEAQSLAKETKVSMAIALDSATKLIPGTVLKGELEKEDGKIIYSFEILPTPESTIVKEVNVDAISGKVLKTEYENLNKKESKEGKESKELKKGKKGTHKYESKNEEEKDED